MDYRRNKELIKENPNWTHRDPLWIANSKPLFQLIEDNFQTFQQQLGNIYFKVYDDGGVTDKALYDDFIKSFLEYFAIYEISNESSGYWYLQVRNFLNRKLPIYCQSMRQIFDNMFNTQDMLVNVTGQNQGSTSSINDGTTNSDTEGSTHSVALAGVADTPQNELDLDINNLSYASKVNKSQTDATSNSTTHTATHQTGSTESFATVGNDTHSKGRGKDIFSIVQEWRISGYDIYSSIFDEMKEEGLFLLLFN